METRGRTIKMNEQKHDRIFLHDYGTWKYGVEILEGSMYRTDNTPAHYSSLNSSISAQHHWRRVLLAACDSRSHSFCSLGRMNVFLALVRFRVLHSIVQCLLPQYRRGCTRRLKPLLTYGQWLAAINKELWK